jgi:hypothetical protein
MPLLKEMKLVLNPTRAPTLAHALRYLRESTWPNRSLTQAQLAEALSTEGRRVRPGTLSFWESPTNPKTPPPEIIHAYARLFSTERSIEGWPHLIPENQLTPQEVRDLQKLESQLMDLHKSGVPSVRRSFQFNAGPVHLICPEAPPDLQGPLADVEDPNFTKLRQYGDLDAFIELYGHVRAENPTLDVFYKLASEVDRDDLPRHVILLGIGWNDLTLRFQRAISAVPIEQVAVPDLKDGDIFRVHTGEGVRDFYPDYLEVGEGKRELAADIGYIARLRNPFKVSRTLTMCSGIFSRGVYGAVRCLTDKNVRGENENYLAERFPDGEFAMLVRVPILANETLSPDLQNPEVRLYEWAPDRDVQQ